jgi:hypothetical protein
VFVYLDESFQLALDCVAMLGPRRGIAYGWAMTPRGEATDLSVSAGPEGDCPIEHCSFHPRPDVTPTDPRRASVNGFTLVFETPEDPRELTLTLTAGAARLGADLRDTSIEQNLFKATAERAWHITFGLMREAAGHAALAGLLRYQGRPFGAFADWIARLPVVRGRAENFGQMAEVEALTAAGSGETLAMLRANGGLPPEATVSAAVIGWLRGAEGALPEPMLLPLADEHAVRLPAALGHYGRLDPAVLDRLQGIEMILHAVPRPGEEIWLRCVPGQATIPDLLDAACRANAAALALPVEAAASAGLDLLRQVIARREAAFGPMLGALAAPEGAPARLPRLALILGADDPAAARLFHVTAEEFERRADTVLVMGAAADDVAQVFARRGKVKILVGVEAAATLREAAGRAGILAVDAAAYADAITAGAPEAAFSRPLDAGEVARLLALHAVAGCAPSLTDSLQRLLRARRTAPAEQRFAPIQRAWSNRHAAELVNAHLQRLWAAGSRAPESRPRESAHA